MKYYRIVLLAVLVAICFTLPAVPDDEDAKKQSDLPDKIEASIKKGVEWQSGGRVGPLVYDSLAVSHNYVEDCTAYPRIVPLVVKDETHRVANVYSGHWLTFRVQKSRASECYLAGPPRLC